MSELSDDEPINEAVRALARILFAEGGPEATLATIARTACDLLGDCDAASVTVLRNGRLETPVSTSDVAAELDQVQYETDAGPCLDAMAAGTAVPVDDFESDERWPKLAGAARERRVRSALGLPLMAGGGALGCLNLYSFQPSSFAGTDGPGAAFAGHAAVTLANATAYHQATDLARNLAIALERRDVIGQAKGILMARQGVDADQAFDVLRRASQRSNRKLHELAADMVERHLAGRPEL